MAGFKIIDSQSGQRTLPRVMVYTYTWDFPLLHDVKSEDVNLKETTLPSITYETDTIKTGHATYEFAKGVKWEDIKLSFYDTESVALKLLALSEKVWNATDGLGAADDYMDESTIKVYSHTGDIVYDIKIKNSWVKAVSFTNLTYESSGMNVINVTLAYSWAEWSGADGVAVLFRDAGTRTRKSSSTGNSPVTDTHNYGSDWQSPSSGSRGSSTYSTGGASGGTSGGGGASGSF